MQCPCKDCPDRKEGCHADDVCKRGYPEWRREEALLKEAQKKHLVYKDRYYQVSERKKHK